jgi:hypothetical protein
MGKLMLDQTKTVALWLATCVPCVEPSTVLGSRDFLVRIRIRIRIPNTAERCEVSFRQLLLDNHLGTKRPLVWHRKFGLWLS